MQGGSIISVSPSSPSFNTYDRVAERVVQEFRQESGYQVEDEATCPDQQQFIEDEDEFEFAFVCNKEPVMSADEIFYKGQIKPTYPVPQQYTNNQIPNPNGKTSQQSHRLPLGKLMKMSSQEASLINSSSSSCKEADELEKVKPGTYCVWTPREADNTTSGGRRRRNRWKLRELLYTNGKDHKEAVCISSQDSIMGTPEEEDCGGNYSSSSSNRDMKSSFLLPNKHDLLGIFSNINGFSRHLHPF